MEVCAEEVHHKASDLPKSSRQTGAGNTKPPFQWKLSAEEGAHLSQRLGNQAFVRFLPMVKAGTLICDIGSGDGFYSDLAERHGFSVRRVDSALGQPYERELWRSYGGIWACHVLEHMRNPGISLDKMYRELEPGGVLAVTVPPAKHNIVGGHVSLWNAGLLLYHLVLSGFDCREAMVGSYGYNISLIVAKKPCVVDGLVHDNGDIEKVAPYFPVAFKHGDSGQLGNINWQA